MIKSLLMRNGPYELVIAPEGFPGKKYRGRYCYEHILVWWQNMGRLPLPGHVIHHGNENKRDNQFGNLEEKTVSKHSEEHGRDRGTPQDVICGNCESKFTLNGSIFRRRKKQSLTGVLFCGRECAKKVISGPRQSSGQYEHGKLKTYRYRKCRCKECRAANAADRRRWKKTKSLRSTQVASGPTC